MIPNPFRVPPFHDPDAPSEREAVGRLYFFAAQTEYWGTERLAAIMANDGKALQEAFSRQREAQRLLTRWRAILTDARTAAGVAA
jgi:hypothetical protein